MPKQPAPRAWFQSIRDPQERYELDDIVYKAKDGALLEGRQIRHWSFRMAGLPSSVKRAE